MSKKEGDLKREIARDFIALGGIPFFAIVLVRVYILSQPNYFYQFLIAGGIFLGLYYFVKQNVYSGLSLIALFFTANHYQEYKYSIFGSVIYLGLLFSLHYLGKDKKKIGLGVVLGAIAIFISRMILA